MFAYMKYLLYICIMENKNKTIVVRVTNTELNLIKEKAFKLGLSISSYLRMLGLTKNINDDN